jgi:hypothetical protein
VVDRVIQWFSTSMSLVCHGLHLLMVSFALQLLARYSEAMLGAVSS